MNMLYLIYLQHLRIFYRRSEEFLKGFGNNFLDGVTKQNIGYSTKTCVKMFKYFHE